MVHLYIGTPSARDFVFAAHHVAVATACHYLGAAGIRVSMSCVQGYDISEERDCIAAEFLKSDATHLLFWDDDISCDGRLPLKLLSFKKELVATVCPVRDIQGPLLKKFLADGHEFKSALDLSHSYAVLNCKWPPTEGELTEADAVGAGMMLISRSVFERIMSKTEVREYATHALREKVKEFFHRGQKVDGEKVPEDWSFCIRYRKLGGQVFVYPFAEMGHHGSHRYGGSFAATRMALTNPSS